MVDASKLPNPPVLCQDFSCGINGTEHAFSYARSGYTSGGGFSDEFSQPAYQQTAV